MYRQIISYAVVCDKCGASTGVYPTKEDAVGAADDDGWVAGVCGRGGCPRDAFLCPDCAERVSHAS